MTGLKKLAKASAVAVFALGIAAPGFAGTDIPYTWNSDDHDSRAKFESYGDHFYAYEYAGSNFVDYQWTGVTEQRWFIPGDEDKTRKDLNLNIGEGRSVLMQVCQNKEAFPDDCSSFKSGVA